MMEDASAKSLHPLVRDCIEPGSTIQTDGWEDYTYDTMVKRAKTCHTTCWG